MMPDDRNDGYAMSVAIVGAVTLVACVVLGLIGGVFGPLAAAFVAGASYTLGIVVGIYVGKQ